MVPGLSTGGRPQKQWLRQWARKRFTRYVAAAGRGPALSGATPKSMLGESLQLPLGFGQTGGCGDRGWAPWITTTPGGQCQERNPRPLSECSASGPLFADRG